MKTNLSDLIAALPQEEDGPELLGSAEAQERLQAIFADLAYRPVPVHSLHRMWTMGELSTQVALAYASLWVRGLFADAKTKERQAIETNLRVALKMVHRLGYLRGAATKLGQAFGSLPELLPSQVVSTLDMLHAQAPPMHFSLIARSLTQRIGPGPVRSFCNIRQGTVCCCIHRTSASSDSQVRRRGGSKNPIPGIGRAMQADLRNLMALIFPMRLSKSAASIKGQVEAMRDMLAQEMDYVHEARNMREAMRYSLPKTASSCRKCSPSIHQAVFLPPNTFPDRTSRNFSLRIPHRNCATNSVGRSVLPGNVCITHTQAIAIPIPEITFS